MPTNKNALVRYKYLDGNHLPPVDGMMGSSFIVKQNGLFDFGEGTIFG